MEDQSVSALFEPEIVGISVKVAGVTDELPIKIDLSTAGPDLKLYSRQASLFGKCKV